MEHGAGLASGTPWSAADERPHRDVAVEAWWWWASVLDPSSGAMAGAYVGLELRGDRFGYWAGLVREGEPYLYVEELDGTGRRAGLELKPPEMWAGHDCDVPFGQWSVGNEAHGVLLDDPSEAWRRAHGTLVPCTFDIEWYASSAPEPLVGQVAGGGGYRQWGEADVRVELREGIVEFVGAGERVHVWGVPYLPTSFAMPSEHTERHGLRAPYRRSDGRLIDQVVTTSPSLGSRWWVSG